MPAIKISQPGQFFYESKTWERLLEFFRQECAFLNNRLSEVIDHNTGKDFLSFAEHFQNQFISKGEVINALRYDVQCLLHELKGCQDTGEAVDNSQSKKQTKLRNEMEWIEKEFKNLRDEFNKCLLSKA